MTVVPLVIDAPVWPLPDAVLAAVKDAKASLELATQVLPQKAVPGAPVRVLALAGVPKFACDCALVRDWRDAESLRSALRWVLTDEPLEKGFTFADWLARFGWKEIELTDGERWELENQ